MRPTTFAALVQEIALQYLLRRYNWNLFTILKFQPCFDSLHEGNGVAWAAFALVAHWSGEVVAVDVSEVVCFREILVWNVLRCGILFSPFLRWLKGRVEELVVSSAELVERHPNSLLAAHLSKHVLWMNGSTAVLGRGGALFICDHKQFVIFAVLTLSVVFMVLLQFAGACLPAKVGLIDRGNEQVHLVTWHMLQMQIASFVDFITLCDRCFLLSF